MRESMSDAQKPEGGSIKHDVSVPVLEDSGLHERGRRGGDRRAMPGARICAFGHHGRRQHPLQHFPARRRRQAGLHRPLARNERISSTGWCSAHGGSISAEHGIGQLKRDELAAIRPPIEIELMRRIKHAFDPAGIMNPDKVREPQNPPGSEKARAVIKAAMLPGRYRRSGVGVPATAGCCSGCRTWP